jgi:phage shock protein PspC (stress-responsive transcriptional regulator)
MKYLKFYLEQQLFGVCTYIGEKMGVAISSIRLYFIYISFLTLGSPVVVYLFMAFWLNLRKYLRMQRNLLRGF